MSETTLALKSELKKGVALLQTLRDEVRLKMHLASMDLKDEWAKLEPRVVDAEQRALAEISEASRAALTEMIEKLAKLRSSLF